MRDLTNRPHEQRKELDRLHYLGALVTDQTVECVRCGVTSPGHAWLFGCPFCHRSQLESENPTV